MSFLVGGISDRSMCFYLENTFDPNSHKVLSLLQYEVEREMDSNRSELKDLKQTFNYLHDVKVVDIINRCHQNESLFHVLQLSLDQKIKIYQDNKYSYLNLSEIIMFKEV